MMAGKEVPITVAKAVKRLMVDYCYGVDWRSDAEDVVSLFTPDAKIDFSSVGFPTMDGQGAIRDFYASLVEGMSHEFHDMANFRAVSWDGQVAVAEAYVIGMGRSNSGEGVLVHVKYRMECIETASGWRCRHFSLAPMMPA
jgi:ketosteroid isomerase-like protein